MTNILENVVVLFANRDDIRFWEMLSHQKSLKVYLFQGDQAEYFECSAENVTWMARLNMANKQLRGTMKQPAGHRPCWKLWEKANALCMAMVCSKQDTQPCIQ